MLFFEAKLGIEKLFLKSNVAKAKELLINNCVNNLAFYRRMFSTDSGAARLIMPESMKVYIVTLLGLFKTPAFETWDHATLDSKIANISQFRSCSIMQFWTRIYPKLYSVSEIMDPDKECGTVLQANLDEIYAKVTSKAMNIPSSVQCMINSDAYILSNSECIYIYFPTNVNNQIIEYVILFTFI